MLPAGQRLPRYLTQDELRRFLAVIADPRDRLLFALVYQHGLRVGEVALLTRGDVDLERGRILIRRLKGGAWSEQPLFRDTAVLLTRHLATFEEEPGAALFPGRDGALRKRQIQARFVHYRDRAGLPAHLTCHSLRHAIATHLLDAGAALEFVQDHLGHQSIRSTSIYARITDHHRAAVFERLERVPTRPRPATARRRLPPNQRGRPVPTREFRAGIAVLAG